MKYTYEYRTSDNARHTGVIDAADREAAFQALKSQGIKPGRLTEAPGFFNALLGKGKRWITIGVLGVGCLVLGGLYYLNSSQLSTLNSQLSTQSSSFLTDTTRRQVIGDSAIIDKGILDGWSDVFANEGERFLAGFAVPGVPVKVRNTSEDEIRAALSRHILPTAEDTLESRQIKAMVEGMKAELRSYLADGGTIVGYGQCLVQRQEEEIAHYERAKAEIDRLAKNAPQSSAGTDTDDALRSRWETLNDQLRHMGIRLVPWPEG